MRKPVTREPLPLVRHAVTFFRYPTSFSHNTSFVHSIKIYAMPPSCARPGISEKVNRKMEVEGWGGTTLQKPTSLVRKGRASSSHREQRRQVSSGGKEADAFQNWTDDERERLQCSHSVKTRPGHAEGPQGLVLLSKVWSRTGTYKYSAPRPLSFSPLPWDTLTSIELCSLQNASTLLLHLRAPELHGWVAHVLPPSSTV